MNRFRFAAAAFAALMLGLATPATTEQLTTVGIVDINRVYNSFYRDSQSVRELERLRREFQAEINEQVRELESLRDRRLQAQEIGDDRRVDDLTERIEELEQFLADLTRRRRAQLESRQNELLSDSFLRDLQEAIQFVAESEGYTVVMRTDSAGLQWWSAEVDISDLVLERLLQVVDR